MAIVIDLQVGGKNADPNLRRIEAAVERLDRVLGRLGTSINGVASGAARTSGQRPKAGKRPPQAFETIHDEIAWLQTQPGWRAQAKADALRKRANRMQTPPSMWAKLGQMFGGKVPGAMKTAYAASGGGTGITSAATSLARLGVVAGVAVGAILALTVAFKAATDRFKELADRQAKFGGNASQGQAAQFIEQWTGVSPDAFSGNLSGTVGRAGINPMGGPYGDMNYAEKLRKAAEYVAQAATLEEARFRAAQMGQTDLAKLFYLRPDQKQSMLSPELSGMNPKAMRRASQAMADLTLGWERMKIALFEALVPLLEFGAAIARLLKRMQDFVFNAAKKVGDGAQAAYGAARRTASAMPGGTGGIAFDVIDWAIRTNQEADKVVEHNTRATMENTRAMKDFTEILGGGQRAQNALPSKLRGVNLTWDDMNRVRHAFI